MKVDDPTVRDILRRSMVARIATLSHSGRPSITSLYFVFLREHIWLGTPQRTLAARHVMVDPRVSLLLQAERGAIDQRVVRISGCARVRTDRQAQRSYALRAARKYVLTPGAIRDMLAHLRLLPIRRQYRAQSAEKGQSCVIEVIPERVEILTDEK